MLGKPTASLSSALLARKGHARPAMRPQGFVSLTPGAHEDLGWNDMGEEAAPAPAPAPAPVPVAAPAPVAEPPVLRQRAELARQVAPTPVVSKETLARVAREARAHKSRAAFTLRLEPDRHLRLRLASAVNNRSAQQLVTEALDAFLDSLPDVDALARQLAAREGSGER